MNFKHLRYFQAVAHAGRLTSAAEQLNLSASALSTQIRLLEETLGHDLFERRGRSLVLTEAGHVALNYADTIFAAGDELISTLRGQGRATRPRLDIGALATLSRNFQLERLTPVLASGGVEIHIQSGDLATLMAALTAHNLDMVLSNQAPVRDDDSAWTIHRLAEQEVSLVGTPKRVKGCADLTSLLADHPLILPSRRSGVRSGFDAMVSRLGLEFEIAAEVDDMAMLRLLASADAGLAVAPPVVVRDELASGQLVEAVSLSELRETFYAITVDRRFQNPLVAQILKAPANS